MFQKTKYLCFLLFFSFFLVTWNLGLGASNVDSLRTALTLAKNDTNKVNLLNLLARELQNSNPDTAILLCNQALKIAEKFTWKKGMANSLRNLGWLNYLKGNYPLAMNYYNRALSIYRMTNDKKGISASLGNIGSVYKEQGDYPKAMEHYFKALEIDKELGNQSGIAVHLGNIGSVYKEKGDYLKALEHYFKALEIAQELGDKNRIAILLGNIGNIYAEQGDYPKALEHYYKALEIAQELGDNNGIARHLGNIGLVYSEHGDYPQALEHYFKALEIAQYLGNKSHVSVLLGNIGLIYAEQGDYPKALEHYFKALEIAQELGNKRYISNWLGNIGIVYKKHGDYPKALKHYYKALEIAQELKDKSGIAIQLGNVGILFIFQKCYTDAEDYMLQAISLSDSIRDLINFMDFENSMATLYSEAPIHSTAEGKKRGTQNGVYSLAIEHYEKYLRAKDTLFNEDKSESMGKLEARHEFALIEMEIAKKQKEEQAAVVATVKRRDKIQFTGLVAVLIVVVLIVALVLFSKFNIAPKIKMGSLFIALILLFEFMLVWVDAPVEKFTGGNPAYKLFINALLALGFYIIQQTLVRFLPVTVKQSAIKANTFGMTIICIFSFVHLCSFSFVPFVVKENLTTKNTKNFTKDTKLDSLKLLLSQYETQTNAHRSQNKMKEAFETLKKYGDAKDSLQKCEQSQEEAKIMERNSMELQKKKQKQEADEKAKSDKEKKERKDLLIYSIILIGIIFLFITFSVTGRLHKGKFVMPQRVLEGGLFVSFLLFFEFILVFADPYIEQLTGGAPAWKFCFNVMIASLIFPVHGWLEGKMQVGMFRTKMKMVQEDKRLLK